MRTLASKLFRWYDFSVLQKINMSLSTKDVIECLEINFYIIFSFLFSVNIVIKMIIPLISILITRVEIRAFSFIPVFLFWFWLPVQDTENHSATALLSFTAVLNPGSESDCLIGEESKNET